MTGIMDDVTKEADKTRRSLVSRLKNWDDHDSWRQFFNKYWRLIYTVAIQSGLNEAEAHDAVQTTIITVAKTMPDLLHCKGEVGWPSPRGPMKSGTKLNSCPAGAPEAGVARYERCAATISNEWRRAA